MGSKDCDCELGDKDCACYSEKEKCVHVFRLKIDGATLLNVWKYEMWVQELVLLFVLQKKPTNARVVLSLRSPLKLRSFKIISSSSV